MLEFDETYNKVVKGLKTLYDRNAVIVDTETTGFSKKDEVIDLAVVSFQTGQVIYQKYFLPQAKINLKALEVHQLSLERLKALNAASIKDATRELDLIFSSNFPIITFNSSFDRRLLEQSLTLHNNSINFNSKWHCAMQACKLLYGKRLKLEDVCKKLSLQPGNHSALEDCLATRRILLKIIKYDK